MIRKSWTRFALLSLVTSAMAAGCVITTTDNVDDDDFSFAGSSGDEDTGGKAGTGGTASTGGKENTGGSQATAGASTGGVTSETGGAENVAGGGTAGTAEDVGSTGGSGDNQPAVCTSDASADACASCVQSTCSADSDTDYCAACTGSCATEIDCFMQCMKDMDKTSDDCGAECGDGESVSSAEALDLVNCILIDPEAGTNGCEVDCFSE